MPTSSTSSFTTSSSFSYSSSSSSTNNNGRMTGASHSTQSYTNPQGATTVRTTHQTHGGPAVEETRHYDQHGRELLEAPASVSSNQRRIQDIEVEDVTDESDADKKYREAMEDEYAKREGGA